MSIELDQNEDGSKVAIMVADGQPAWHTLGQLRGTPATVAEALELAYLDDWVVRKVPLMAATFDDKGQLLPVPFTDKFATVRNSPFEEGKIDTLGVVGKIWRPFQNEELAEAAQLVIDESGGNIHTAGALFGGKNVFVSIKLPEQVMIGGADALDLYIVATTAHDGSASNQFRITPVRPVCKNTLDLGRALAKSSWSFRHTSGMDGKVMEAREGLKLTWKYAEKMKEVFDGMITSPFSESEMQTLLEKLIPDPESDQAGWIDRTKAQRGSIISIFNNSDTCEEGRGTRWAAYNAITEYADWYRPGSEKQRAKESLGIGASSDLKKAATKLLVTA